MKTFVNLGPLEDVPVTVDYTAEEVHGELRITLVDVHSDWLSPLGNIELFKAFSDNAELIDKAHARELRRDAIGLREEESAEMRMAA